MLAAPSMSWWWHWQCFDGGSNPSTCLTHPACLALLHTQHYKLTMLLHARPLQLAGSSEIMDQWKNPSIVHLMILSYFVTFWINLQVGGSELTLGTGVVVETVFPMPWSPHSPPGIATPASCCHSLTCAPHSIAWTPAILL